MTNTPQLLGRFANLEMRVLPRSFVIGSAIIFVLLFGIATELLRLPLATAIIGALLGVALHWLNDLMHNIGHALAAWKIGHPMRGVLFGENLLFGRSLYPDDEPPLPARVHIVRALGGPLFSIGVGMAFGGLAALAWNSNVLFKWLSLWGLLQNMVIFGPGAFVPLNFTDGGTLMHWLPRLRSGG